MNRPAARSGPLRMLLRGAAACALAGWALAAQAEPAATQTDPVLRVLQEHGYLEAEPFRAPLVGLASEASDWATALVGSAMDLLGVPYRRGGQSASTGFDCSGFTRHVFESSLGMMLPRRSKEQAATPGWLQVERAELKPGDLVFFNTLRSAFSHVGIYVGDGKFIHAPRTGARVRVEDMRAAYWSQRYNGARRAPTAALPATAALPDTPSATAPPPAAPMH